MAKLIYATPMSLDRYIADADRAKKIVDERKSLLVRRRPIGVAGFIWPL